MRAAARLLLVGATVALIGTVVVWEALHPAPGGLSPAHRMRELDGNDGCVRCHGDATTPMQEACTACHSEIAAQIAARRGLHGNLAQSKCGGCHVEHHDGQPPLIDAHAWRSAGVGDPRSYDHRFVAFTLEDRHRQLACVACHPRAETPSNSIAGVRFLDHESKGADAQRCTSCHQDAHQGALGADCAACHGQQRPFAEAARFAHDARFPLTGGHRNVACARCHVRSELALAAPGGARQASAVRRCVACHANPHVPASGSELPLARSDDCARCHTTGGFAGVRFGADQHARLGVALDGPHARAACSACHTPARALAPAEPLAMQRCGDCHSSLHRAAFVHAAAKIAEAEDESLACALCHDPRAGSFARPAARMTPQLHDASGFELTAPHAKRDCADCHGAPVAGETPARRTAEYARAFPGRTAVDCRSCHGDAHASEREDGAFAGRACLDCHEHAAFTPATFTLAHHGKTRFPLVGAHAAVACSACHPRFAGDGIPRRFGGTPRACAACHDDPHRGAFDRAGMPREVDGRSGCARCHDSVAFGNAARGFDHARWTGVELLGRHARARCVDCHLERPPRRATEPPASRRDCAGCHVDPHARQFDRDGRTDCARCHDAARTFLDLRFDHARDARFALDATHKKLACAACHRPWPLPTGGAVVRYTPLGRRCGDCHTVRGQRGGR